MTKPKTPLAAILAEHAWSELLASLDILTEDLGHQSATIHEILGILGAKIAEERAKPAHATDKDSRHAASE